MLIVAIAVYCGNNVVIRHLGHLGGWRPLPQGKLQPSFFTVCWAPPRGGLRSSRGQRVMACLLPPGRARWTAMAAVRSLTLRSGVVSAEGLGPLGGGAGAGNARLDSRKNFPLCTQQGCSHPGSRIPVATGGVLIAPS